MIFYTSDGCLYEGMSKEVITRLRKDLGKETVFVSKADFDLAVQAKQNVI